MPSRRRRKPTKSKKQHQQNHQQTSRVVGTPHDNDVDDDDSTTALRNFVASAGRGCHMARRMDQNNTALDWILEWESIDPRELDVHDEIPDIALDPESGTLTVCNVHTHHTTVAYITLFEWTLRNRRGRILEQGTSTNEEGATRPCTTLIVLCPPQTFAHLVTIDELSQTPDPSQWEHHIQSDVQAWRKHSAVDDFYRARTVGFPLHGPGPFLCTQGVGGHLTHFFEGNQHAIDFRCPRGTPLRAVGKGIVRQVETHHRRVTGIAVANLFQWNAILIELDSDDGDEKATQARSTSSHSTSTAEEEENTQSSSQSQQQSTTSSSTTNNNIVDGPIFVEYVHIATATVQVGDRVREGQIIGTSGGIGFSPEDHLHFAAYRSGEPHAPTVGFAFHATVMTTTDDDDNHKTPQQQESSPETQQQQQATKTFQPVAGEWYNLSGKATPPEEDQTQSPRH